MCRSIKQLRRPEGPASDEELRAQGGFTLRQSDFRIKPVSVGLGALKLKDELQFPFTIVALREAIHHA